MNPSLSDMVSTLLNSDVRAFAIAAIVVPLVVIGVLVTLASLRLRVLRKHQDDWWGDKW